VLENLVRGRAGIRDRGPCLVVEGDLAPVPRSSPRLHAGLENHELVSPGREATRAPERVELGEDRDERVVRRLRREVGLLRTPDVPQRAASASELEARPTEQQRVQVGDDFLTIARRPRQADDPVERLVALGAGAKTARRRLRLVTIAPQLRVLCRDPAVASRCESSVVH
jgi:hypothetical protein